jgi:hypothetical protein
MTVTIFTSQLMDGNDDNPNGPSAGIWGDALHLILEQADLSGTLGLVVDEAMLEHVQHVTHKEIAGSHSFTRMPRPVHPE